MRSAIYYPHTTVRSENLLKSSLLLWDELCVIAPFDGWEPDYGEQSELARAWRTLGKPLVPNDSEKRLAHDSIARTLDAGIPPAFKWLGGTTGVYEVWPQKLAEETINMLATRGLTSGALLNGDFPFAPAAGVMVMAKLADAIAGEAYSRVTDYPEAFALAPDAELAEPLSQAHLVALEVLDTSAFALDDLVAFRERERNERDGEQLRALRHSYLAKVEEQARRLNAASTKRQAEQMNNDFRSDMERDLNILKGEIARNRIGLVLKPVVVAAAVAGVAAGVGLTGGTALAAIGAAAFGTSAADIADKMAKMFEAGYGFSAKQREAMSKHPMAYLYELKRAR